MKKTFVTTLLTILCVAFIAPVPIHAAVGDLGFFGGITDGKRLPKTTEILLESTSKNKNAQDEFIYKEMIFLTGRPFTFEGLLSVRANGRVDDTTDVGTYTVTYRVTSSDTSPENVNIDRNIVFNVNWRRVNKQIIKDYSVRSWRETISVDGSSFTLDNRQSQFGISIIEDNTPGVTYYRGDVSQYSVYTGGEDGSTTLEAYGSFYGYSSAWSNTETHRLDATVYNSSENPWQIQYQVRPSVTVYKTLQYTENEPTAISFEGNYKEVMVNESGLSYDIFVSPQQFYDIDKSGSINISSRNEFEQLIAPDTSFLKGHFAESDIKRLFAMQVLEGHPTLYKPDQAITRGQFVTAVVKAIKLPIDEAPTSTKKSKQPIVIVFPDVQMDDPSYPYIMAAYKAGIAIGRSNGHFYSQEPIEREEAMVILLRCLGLSNLGLSPTPMTAFVDDAEIADWARKELYAAERIGLISQDSDGKIYPKQMLSKAEAAALINRLVTYMCTDLKLDYADHIVNITY